MTFKFNKDYKDLAQVEHLWEPYMRRFSELEAAGQYPYNASFAGSIPGAAGDNEDTAIYLLQKLRAIREDSAKLADFLASGGREVTEMDDGEVLRGTVAEFGFYMGGSGFRVREGVRLVARNGKPSAIFPPRARTRGFMVEGRVFIREAV
jgi:hypothetical protein